MGKLQETVNFVELYVYACGRSETPMVFHEWACLSLLAAAIEDRVYLMRMGNRTRPNLYVMLIGKSGYGKSHAIENALKLANNIPPLQERTIRGSLTAQALLDLMGGRTTQLSERGKPTSVQVPPCPHPWIAYPELLNSLRTGQRAQEFITQLTDLWGGSPVPVRERTRMWGDVTIKNPCINFIGGTTRAWLTKCVSEDAITGGFFGRVVAVEHKEIEERVPNPMLPHDYADVWDWLQARLMAISTLEGEVRMTTKAQDNWTSWYLERGRPHDEALEAAWKRDPELVSKIAILLSVADGDSLIIEEKHMITARNCVLRAREAMPDIVTMAHTSKKAEHMHRMGRYLEAVGKCQRSQLTRYMTKYGVTAKDTDEFLATYISNGQILVEIIGKTRWYIWRKRKWITETVQAVESPDPSEDQPVESVGAPVEAPPDQDDPY